MQGHIKRRYGSFVIHVGYHDPAGIELVERAMDEVNATCTDRRRIEVLAQIVGRLVQMHGQSLKHMLELTGLDTSFEVCGDPDLDLMEKLK